MHYNKGCNIIPWSYLVLMLVLIEYDECLTHIWKPTTTFPRANFPDALKFYQSDKMTCFRPLGASNQKVEEKKPLLKLNFNVGLFSTTF